MRLRPDQLIAEARRGVPDRLGQLLDAYRNYLVLLAKTQIDEKLRARVNPSDLVQETMLGACRDFAKFHGRNERQLLAWLRQILINRLHVFVQQHVLAEKRDVRREVSLEEVGRVLKRSAASVDSRVVAANVALTPSAIAMQRENAVLLADQLAQMSPQYREVIELRNLRGLPFDEVGRRMNRTAAAARMLWLRAIRQLRQRMQETG
jgi:RNA polymerase sigma-70 factor (ECF subfamily)